MVADWLEQIMVSECLEQRCTTHGPDPGPERVISGPRSMLKIQETSE